MKNFTIGLFFGVLTCGSSYAADIYNGTLVGAHSQKGKLISVEQLSAVINQTDVDSSKDEQQHKLHNLI